jgi:hypothetical protein
VAKHKLFYLIAGTRVEALSQFDSIAPVSLRAQTNEDLIGDYIYNPDPVMIKAEMSVLSDIILRSQTNTRYNPE